MELSAPLERKSCTTLYIKRIYIYIWKSLTYLKLPIKLPTYELQIDGEKQWETLAPDGLFYTSLSHPARDNNIYLGCPARH